MIDKLRRVIANEPKDSPLSDTLIAKILSVNQCTVRIWRKSNQIPNRATRLKQYQEARDASSKSL